ncbi:hypothetical protein [Cyanobium sp. ATX 6F1]|uniref:hypothetical protein n=1 Tax=Cyanobium sp. ATX 6F1 TaxID=2823702 RepID=UPI0020CBED11|nr:hypothetical protein [Cyanobium sp. ATX 6F1]MCP9915972.1 hypothetical protein [Cyanobium sp. ATX 6F1]
MQLPLQACLKAAIVWVTCFSPISSMFGKLQSIAGKAGNLAAQLQEKTVNEYMPLIAKLLREKAGPAVLDILNDPSKITELSRTVYQAMPMPVRMAIKEDAFNSAVLTHKDRLIPLIRSQIEVENTDQAEDIAVASLEHEGGEMVVTGAEVAELTVVELDAEEVQIHQAISMGDTDETSNITLPST